MSLELLNAIREEIVAEYAFHKYNPEIIFCAIWHGLSLVALLLVK